MTDRTTVQLKDTTKNDLEALKRVDGESYDSVIKMLIANYSNESTDSGVDSEELARELSRRIDYAEIATKTATELEGRMR